MLSSSKSLIIVNVLLLLICLSQFAYIAVSASSQESAIEPSSYLTKDEADARLKSVLLEAKEVASNTVIEHIEAKGLASTPSETSSQLSGDAVFETTVLEPELPLESESVDPAIQQQYIDAAEQYKKKLEASASLAIDPEKS